MPYIKNYTNILDEENIEYRLVYWNRLNKNEGVENSIEFKDQKNQFNRNLFDYFRYYIFLKRYFKKNVSRNDKIIFFSIQILPAALFIKNDFLIDIRDYHKFVDIKLIKKLVRRAKMIIVSSEKFKEFINHKNILVNHNFNLSPEILPTVSNEKSTKLRVSNIGAIRDFEANSELLSSLKNHTELEFYFHGDGPDMKNLENFVRENNIKNANFTGRYIPSEENELYINADVINLVRDNKSYNNRIALPNRLYKAAKFNKPIITTSNTYLEDVVKNYNLGISLVDNKFSKNDINSIHNLIENNSTLLGNQKKFLDKIHIENEIFVEEIKKFTM